MSSTNAVGNVEEAEILAVLDEYVAAHADRDVDRMLAPLDEDAVRFSLAPPLKQAAGTTVGDAEGLRCWLATFEGPVRIEYEDLSLVQNGGLAVACALSRMTATPSGAGKPGSIWYRSTFAFRRTKRGWRIIHVHDSTPFYMDGSFRAAVDLEP